MRRRSSVLAVMLGASLAFVAGCSSLDDAGSPDTPAAPTLEVTGAITFVPGEAVGNQLTIDGTVVVFSLFVPSDYTRGSVRPLLLALPPGGQGPDQIQQTMQPVYMREAERRGWVVASPVAPDGVRFFDGSERFVGPLMERLAEDLPPEGGRPHLGGMSNGGISAFRVAALEPSRWASVTVYPGFARSSSDFAALEQLTDIPVVLFVGETDTQWIEPAQETADRLRELGGEVTYELIAGEDHIIESLWTGTRLWDTFAAARLAAAG